LRDHRLERAFVSDSSGSWNIYGERDDASDQDGYQRVVDGIMSLEFLCKNARSEHYTPNQETSLPTLVVMVVRMMDDKSFELWERLPEAEREALEKKVCREFRKTVALGGRDT